jgi:hypothetical protein
MKPRNIAFATALFLSTITGAALYGSGSRAAAQETSFGVTYGPWEPDPRSCQRVNESTADGSERWVYTKECRQVQKCSGLANVVRTRRCWLDRPDCRGLTFRGGRRIDTTGVCSGRRRNF